MGFGLDSARVLEHPPRGPDAITRRGECVHLRCEHRQNKKPRSRQGFGWASQGCVQARRTAVQIKWLRGGRGHDAPPGGDPRSFRWSDGRSWCLFRTRFRSWNCCRFSADRSGELIALEQGGHGLKRAEGRPGGPAEGRTPPLRW